MTGIAGITGAPWRAPPETTTRDGQAPRPPATWLSVAGRHRTSRTSCGWRTSATCGRLAGFVYVAFVVDVYLRRVLGWRVSSSKVNHLWSPTPCGRP